MSRLSLLGLSVMLMRSEENALAALMVMRCGNEQGSEDLMNGTYHKRRVYSAILDRRTYCMSDRLLI